MDEFFERMRQRKIVQWALAYIAAAFALIQVLDIVAQRFGWPEQTIRFFILALAIGFFVTLVLAWYHGEKGAQRVTGPELLFLALLLTIGGAVAWRLAPSAAEQTTKTKPSDSASHQRVRRRFLRSQPRRIGLGPPLGRDPFADRFQFTKRETDSRVWSCS